MLVRLTRITGVDLNVFDFDYDLTWAGFFLNAHERVYGRYGGRDAKSAEARLSIPGLAHAMRAALATHQREADLKPERPPQPPRLAEQLAPVARVLRGECIHCHQVREYQRDEQKQLGQWRREHIWLYPLPENVGITLEVDRGDRVRTVEAGSPAARTGLRAGDWVRSINGVAVASFADAQYGLHRAPEKGQIPITWERDGQKHTEQLAVAEGWRKTNVTWRPSLLDLLPALPLYGDDLTEAEKQALGLNPRRLAFREQEKVPRDAREAGVQPGDVIVGLDGQAMEMTMLEFLAHVRRNYLVGDRVTLNVLRNGKGVDLPWTLR